MQKDKHKVAVDVTGVEE